MITNTQILAIGISAGLTILVPLVLLIVWKCKTHAPLSAAFLGCAAFVLFVLVLEQGLHSLVLKEGSPVLQSPWLYTLYGALAAGLFEETARLLVFRFLLRRHSGRESAVMYGIGHGGIESIVLCGINMVACMIFALNFNAAGGTDSMTAMYHPALSLLYIPAWSFLLSALERMAALALQIALSVLVFQAVKRPGKRWYFLLAILLHAGMDAFSALYQTGIISLAVTELLIVGTTLAICWRVHLLYLRDDWTAEPEDADEVPLPGERELPETDGWTEALPDNEEAATETSLPREEAGAAPEEADCPSPKAENFGAFERESPAPVEEELYQAPISDAELSGKSPEA